MAATANNTPKAKKPRSKRRDISLPKFKQKRAAGRPPIYEAEAHCARATKLAMLGLNDAEIAFQFGINELTFIRWKNDHPEFCKALDAGKIEADSEVIASTFNLATGRVRMPATKVFYDKDKGEAVYAPYVEAIAPSVTAQKFWLLNRQPGRWKERREVDMTITLEQQIAQLTPEERKARLIALQQKAAGALIGEYIDVTPEPEAE
jgi:hypothetical protein